MLESRVGGWLPTDHRIHKQWLKDVVDHVDSNPKELLPVIKEFQDLIENNTRLYLLFNSMFDEIPKKKPYTKDPSGHVQIRDYKHMLALLNHLLTQAPQWSTKSENAGMVGVPINAIFDWPMGTASGYAVFLDPDVNAMLKKVLNVWGEYLSSEQSAKDVLGHDDPASWLSKVGITELEKTANISTEKSDFHQQSMPSKDLKFHELFQCDPTKANHGFKTWDDFFTRHFYEEVRPVVSPDDDNVIANACESLPYNLQKDVKLRDKFWIKGQPYSVMDMLSQDPLSSKFEGGTVYQAFLSAMSYHRWHTPISGTIVKAYVVDGTYFSEPLFEGLGDPEKANGNAGQGKIDEASETTGQGYITAVATRAIIFIEADNPAIGLMAFLGVGMVEVSTCDITVKEGQKVKKGDELGMFHFGGSTHCLLFRKGVKLSGWPDIGKKNENVAVRSKLCIVES